MTHSIIIIFQIKISECLTDKVKATTAVTNFEVTFCIIINVEPVRQVAVTVRTEPVHATAVSKQFRSGAEIVYRYETRGIYLQHWYLST